MNHRPSALQLLAALGFLGLIFFNFPLLSIPQGMIGGYPTIFLVLFGLWLALIVLSFIIVRLSRRSLSAPSHKPPPPPTRLAPKQD